MEGGADGGALLDEGTLARFVADDDANDLRIIIGPPTPVPAAVAVAKGLVDDDDADAEVEVDEDRKPPIDVGDDGWGDSVRGGVGIGVVLGVGGCRPGTLVEDEDELVVAGGAVVGRSNIGWSPTRTRGRPMGIGRSARLLNGLWGTLSSSSCLSSTRSL